jgi:hypothetical protein
VKPSGEVAEWSKALDWNSSNTLTGIRGFESHLLRQKIYVVARIGSFATTCRESRQARKGATVTVRSGAGDPAGAGRLHFFTGVNMALGTFRE